jgi:two-component system response regulator AtoC
MQKIIQDAKKIAKSHASVFITGESGTGKEVIAKIIHLHSYRSQKPFIKVNCAAIPETLIESEFFGYEKGAFTGANNRKEGKFELAHKGTLLLDEVTEIPLFLQSKLLRAVQEKEVERVGGTKPMKVDIRFISTSNRILERAIKEKIFREDLFYRLNVVPLYIPPLRERKEDILSLSAFFLEKFTQEHQKEKKNFSSSAKAALLDYFWPGNVRELSNLIERCVVMDFSPVIEEGHLDLPKTIKTQNDGEQNSLPVGISLYEMEKRFILGTLKRENYNKTKTAKILKIHLRTLRNKLNEYDQRDTQIDLF